MKYQIRFTEGELQGKTFPLGQNAVSIGRSHSNDIRVGTPDVSSKHVRLTLEPEGVVLENLSSRVTQIDDMALQLGDRKPLMAGQVVAMGSLVKFTVEVLADAPAPARASTADDNDATTPPPPKAPAAKPAASMDSDVTMPPKAAPKPASPMDSDRTTPPQAASVVPKPIPQPSPMPTPVPTPVPEPVSEEGADSGNETIAMQTRMASAEELEFMKSSHEKKKIRKTGLWLFLLVVLIAGLVGGYYGFLYKPPEKFVSWPVDETGKKLTAAVQMENCPYLKDIDFEYPKLPTTEVAKAPGKIVVKTALGKYRDVPLRLTLDYFQDKNSLTEERTSTLERWMTTKTTGSENWNFDLIQPIAFYQKAHGIPYLAVSYSRTENNESYVGVAVQIRMADWIFLLQKEIPTRDRWRAEWYIQQMAFFRFSEAFLMNHWEGTSKFQEGQPASILAEAKSLLHRRSPSVWFKAEYLLRSVLCQAQKAGEKQVVADAVELVRELRASQIEYYNQQKITYLLAKTQKNEKEMKKISAELRGVFSSEEDYRFHRIRQDKWD
ncbi:MAG: FHA domain-containing protein [Victivallales bacterium]|nr:FHA domain-containing protein [Victivallales bacterium]